MFKPTIGSLESPTAVMVSSKVPSPPILSRKFTGSLISLASLYKACFPFKTTFSLKKSAKEEFI